MTAVLILHGWQNDHTTDHWTTLVPARLRERGTEVRYPLLPDPFTPSLEEWVDTIRAELAALGGDGDRAVACHSLGCLAWAHLAARLEPNDRPERVCWVAPAGPSFVHSEPAIAAFALGAAQLDAVAGSSAAEPFRLVWSKPDPYCEEGADVIYGDPLGLDAEFLPGMEHLNPDAGLGEWPRMVAWCEDPATRFT